MSDTSQNAEEQQIEDEEKPPEAYADHPNPAIRSVAEKDVSSGVAVAGHPLHAMLVHFPIAFVVATLGADVFYWWSADRFWVDVGIWAAAAAFGFGVLASIVGTLELLAVPGIRVRVASWNHAVAAMVLVAIAAANVGLRLYLPEQVLPNGLMLSTLATFAVGFAGWHGGKLVFDHGVGLIISTRQ